MGRLTTARAGRLRRLTGRRTLPTSNPSEARRTFENSAPVAAKIVRATWPTPLVSQLTQVIAPEATPLSSKSKEVASGAAPGAPTGSAILPGKTTFSIPPRASRLEATAAVHRKVYGGIQELHSILGLGGSAPHPATTIIAMDTESEGRNALPNVVEIGITTLSTRDIANVSPGIDVEEWMAKTKHHHFVIDVTRRPTERMRSSLFARSQFLSPQEACSALQELGQSISADGTTDEIVIVGQNIMTDVLALRRCPSLRMDVHKVLQQPGVRVRRIFDVLFLAFEAEKAGAQFENFKLATLVRSLGVNAKYVIPKTLRGVHNASNDAAYAMMGALLLATRWADIVSGKMHFPRGRTQMPPNPAGFIQESDLLRSVEEKVANKFTPGSPLYTFYKGLLKATGKRA